MADRQDLSITQGRSALIKFGPVQRTDPVTLVVTAIDLTVAGTKLWLTVKQWRRPDPAQDYVIFKAYTVAVPGSFAIDVTGAKNNGTVTLIPAETDDLDPGRAEYDIVLEEPNERETTIARGFFRVKGATLLVTP